MNYLRAIRARSSSVSISRKSTHSCRFLLAAALIAFGAAPGFAANHALLIGAADYENPHITKLKGPPNDVTLMWRLLTEKRGFEPANIIVLADGLKDKSGQPRFPKIDGEPKRDAILKAFAALAEKAKSGDLVMIFYSGHGTEQPVKDTSQDPERGNLDQVMLPTDAGDYDPKTKTVVHGIVDDEIGAALDKIRDKNADVWVVIDACHAGSMTRGVIDGTAVRGIEPSQLGIPAAEPRAVPVKAGPDAWSFQTKSARGSLVGFFAVDSSREAIERAFDEFDAPMIGSGPDRRAGVFTYFLYRALLDGKHKVSRYQDLARLIVSEMRKSENPPSAMPTFDGDLSRPFLAGGVAPSAPVWLAEVDGDKVRVPAGTLHGLAANTVLKLSASPDGPEWTRATLTEVQAIRASALLEKPAGDRPAMIWASVAQPSVSFRLTVAEPPADELTDPAVRKLLEDAKIAANQGAIEWVSSQAAAQLRLRVREGRVWVLPADGEWIRKDLQEKDAKLKIYPLTPSVAVQPEAAGKAASELASILYRRARAANLVRVAQSWNEALDDQGAVKNIKVTAERFTQRGSDADPYRECPKKLSLEGYEPAARGFGAPGQKAEGVPPALHCDIIKVTVKNTGPRDLDVNVSYVDAGGGIQYLIQRAGDACTFTLPSGSGEAVRHAMVRTWQGGKAGTPDTIGREHIVVTAVEQKDGIQSDLCFDQATTRNIGEKPGPTRGTAGSLLRTLRAASLAPAATRGGGAVIEKDSDDAPEASAAVFSFEVMPSRVQ